MKPSPIVCSILVTILLLGFTLQPVMASTLSKDHWAIQSLIDRGLLELDEEGNFPGKEPVDHYTFAVTIAKILEEIETGTLRASEDDYQLLKEITNEFRKDLTELFAKTGTLEDDLSHNIKEQITVDERVNNIVQKLLEIEEVMSRIEANLMKESDMTKELKDSLQEQGELLKQQASGLSEIQDEKIKKLENALESLDKILENQQTEMRHLDNKIAEYRGASALEIGTLAAELAEFKIEIASLDDQQNQTILKLEERVDQMLETVLKTQGELIPFQEQTKVKLDKLNEIITSLEENHRNLSAKLEGEKRNRQVETEQFEAKLLELQNELDFLSTQVGISEEELAALTKEMEDNVLGQLNLASTQKKRLADDLADLKYEFDSYKETMEKELKSAKNTAMIGIAAAVISIVITFINR